MRAVIAVNITEMCSILALPGDGAEVRDEADMAGVVAFGSQLDGASGWCRTSVGGVRDGRG